jgi:hypothetical protein
MLPFFFFGFFDSGDTPTPEVITDTHDGYWRKQWERLHKKKKPVLKEVIEMVKESPSIALAEVKEAVKVKYPTVDYTDVINNLKLQTFIAEQIIIAFELQRIAEDEDDIEMMLLHC